MSELFKYRRKPESMITAIRIDLETDGFRYRKWGGEQFCKPGDWLVNNGGDVYTVDHETFEHTYEEVETGRYAKVKPVWAEEAQSSGVIQTKEGETHYRAGDFLVYNDEGRHDGYAMTAKKFQGLYESEAP